MREDPELVARVLRLLPAAAAAAAAAAAVVLAIESLVRCIGLMTSLETGLSTGNTAWVTELMESSIL